jgi:uncharacterized repeat protein (TIGR01451 family)
VVGIAASYTLQVTNTGTAATTAIATVTDNVASTLTLGTMPTGCNASGQQVTCTIAAGLATNTPVSFVIPVTPTAGASGATLTNTAIVSGGGDPTCPGAVYCSSTVNTPVDAPQLSVQKTASSASFVVGTPATYTLTVTNIGSAATTAATTVTDNVPSSLTLGTMPSGCNASGQQVTCTIATGLATNTPVSFVIPVTPTVAASGTTLTNSATVSGGGDPTCPGGVSCTSTINTPVVAAASPLLQILKTGPATATAGGTIVYAITVTNVGTATATNAILTDDVPTALTYLSVGAPCTRGFPCDLGPLSIGQTITVPAATFAVALGFTGTIVNSASVTSDQTSQTTSSASTIVSQGAGVGLVPTPIDSRWMLFALGLLLTAMAMRSLQTRR